MSGNPLLIVMKFGGAALQDLHHLKKSCDLIEKKIQLGFKVVVVVSAMGKTTDFFLNQAKQIHESPPTRELDMLLSAGERISMALVSMEMQSRGYSAFSFTGSQAGIITNQHHSDAKIINVTPYRIEECIQNNSLPILAGFQGVSVMKEITTLGRGGSDTTAVAIGAALKASVVEFYKDVPGVYSTDPKVDKNAVLYDDLSYDQAFKIIESSEKKLLHPRALHLAKLNQLPLFIQSFEKENLPQNRLGSWIREKFRNPISRPVYEGEKESCSNYSQNQTYFTSPSSMMSH